MSIYEKNMAELKSKFPEVHDWISAEEEDKDIEIFQAGGGLQNLRIKGTRGKSTYLYDMDDPLREERVVCEKLAFSADRVTFIVGIGLGYIVEQIKSKMEKGHKIIVLERNATILKIALNRMDVSELIRHNRIVFSLPDDDSLKITVIKYAYALTPGDVIIIVNNRLMLFSKNYYEMQRIVTENIGCAMVSIMTMLKNAQTFVINEIENLPQILFSAGIRNLFDKFKGIPAFIVSAGPSLQKNIHLLKEAKGKALIIATAPVVRVMLAHDIKPDLIVSIDFSKDNRIHFEGICDCLEIPLVYPTRLASNVVRDYQGEMFVTQDVTGGLTGWLKGNWAFKGHIAGGGSVAIYALMTAISCSCDPIIFLGQDLSFTDTSHVPGVHLCEKIQATQEGQQFLWVDGIFGEKVPTNAAFIGFKNAIENVISQFERKYINATEGGANIRGTEVIPLRECMDQYCKQTFCIDSILKESIRIEEVNFVTLLADIERKLTEMREMSGLCVKGLKDNRLIRKRIGRGLIRDAATRRIIIDNYKISKRVQGFSESFSLLSCFLNKEIFEINRNKYKSDGIARNQFILTAALKALKEVTRRLSQLLGVLKKIESKRLRLTQCNAGKTFFMAGKMFGEIGLYKLAAENFEKALELDRDHYHGFYHLAECYRELGKLGQAEEILKQAQGRFEDIPSVREGFDDTQEVKARWLQKAEKYFGMNDWVNALLYSRKLLREFPHHPRAREIEDAAKKMRDEKVVEIEKAKETEKEHRKLGKNHQEIIEQARRYFQEKNYQQAIDCLENSMEPDSDEFETEAILACCYSEMGNIQRARELLEGLIRKFPESGLFHANLGRVFIRNGLMAEAAGEFEKAYSKEKRYYFVLFEAGAIYMNFKNYDKAIACFENYLRMSPESYELLAKVGTCYLAQGRLSEARQKYQEALRIQPGYEAAAMGLKKIEEMEQRTGFERRPKSERLAV